MQMENHTKADESWNLTASRVLDVAQRALDIFNRSEPNEKRQFRITYFRTAAFRKKS